MQIAHGDADVAELRLERAFGVEHLDPPVVTIRHVDVVRGVDLDPVHDPELSLAGPGRSPVLDPLAVAVVLGDARVAVAVGDVDVALRIPGDVGRTVEVLTFGAGSRRRSPPAARPARPPAARRRDLRPPAAPAVSARPAHRCRPARISGRFGTRIASGLRLKTIWIRPFGSNLITCVDN